MREEGAHFFFPLYLSPSSCLSTQHVVLEGHPVGACQETDPSSFENGPETSLPPFFPDQDEDPDTPKYVRFQVKKTVCAKAMQQIPEQCAFKEQGVRQRGWGWESLLRN